MMAGRPTKYTHETVGKIIDAIKLGATQELAGNYAGVHPSTLSEWKAQFPEFAEGIKRAAGEGAKKWLKVIEDAATSGNWQAAAWKLERRYPRDYGRSVIETKDTTDRDDKPVEDMTLEELDAELARLETGARSSRSGPAPVPAKVN